MGAVAGAVAGSVTASPQKINFVFDRVGLAASQFFLSRYLFS